ncbi:hypothetical protein [Arenibacter amylolyticus]|uniref:hypothetical protein n=1 Tax=Arenibacter amylolyticus TaxID=1406873 RepID=UPI001123B436|nr:hypothetical protein [Arenibacter amylolyticus]
MMKYIPILPLFFLLSNCFTSAEKNKDSTESTLKMEVPLQKDEGSESSSAALNNATVQQEILTPLKDQEVGDAAATTEIHFTELWIWEYLTEEGEWKELWVYREPNLNYWLFERFSSFGWSSAMCEWVVAKPNGAYIFNFQPAEMNTPNSLDTQLLEFEDEMEFPDFWKPTGEIKSFGKPAHGWENFEGEKYEVFFKGQPKPSLFYLGTSEIDMRPVYNFSRLEGDIELPIKFPWGIPKNTVVLSEETSLEYFNMKVHYRFKEISPNSYYVYLPKE